MTDGLVQRRGYVCRCQRLLDLPAREPGGLGELVLCRTAPELGFEPARLARKPLLPRDDVQRQPDRPALGRDRALHRLPDPPDGVGGELVATAPVELLDRARQAERALLDQIEERQATSAETFGDRDDQAQVRLDHQSPRRGVAALDPLRQRHFLRSRQQTMARGLRQEEAERVEVSGRVTVAVFGL